MLTLAQIQAEAYATACEKGWHDRPLACPDGNGGLHIVHDRVLRSHALMHTEITEACAAVDEGHFALYVGENGKPEGMPAEAVDLIIRVCDTTKALGLILSLSYTTNRAETSLDDAKGYAPAIELRTAGSVSERRALAEKWFGRVRRIIDRATESVRVDDWGLYAEEMTLVVLYTAAIVIGFGHDLTATIEAKMRYNRTRPHRHGGKQA